MDFKKFVQQWLLLMIGVFLAAQLLSGIQYESNGALIAVVLTLSLLNLIIRPLLILFALPLVILTLGFGILIINAFLFLLAGEVVPGFHVDGFGSAFWGALLVSLTGLIANIVLGKPKIDMKVNRDVRHKSPEQSSPRIHKDDDDIIDI